MRLLNRIILFAFCFFSTVTCYAQINGLFTPAGEGTLPEKLVVTDNNALLYKNFSSAPTKVEPLTILWRLTIDKAKDAKDPVVEHGGKMYYCVGGPDGEEWGYIETTKVTKWMTRFVYTLLPPKDGCAFRVFNKPFSKEEFTEASDKQIEEATVAVPTGYLAFVLNDEDGLITNQQKQGITTDPNDFKKVMMWNVPYSDGTQESDIGLDIVFVINTTSGMQPIIDTLIDVFNTIAAQVKETRNVHFGLVEYRNGNANDFGARVVSDLTQSYDTFFVNLKSLQANGFIGAADDVLLGLKTAVDKARWHNYTSKHIILIGNAPNRASNDMGGITNFKQLYHYANYRYIDNVQSQAFQQITFHAIACGNNPIAVSEFKEIASNNGAAAGYFENMTHSFVTDNLINRLNQGIEAAESSVENAESDTEFAKSVWNLKKMVKNSQDAKSSGLETNRVLGYACAQTNKGEKCASLCVLVLRDELEDFEYSLNQAYRRLNKLNDGGSGKIEVIYDVFMEEYIGFLSGSATDDDYEKNFEDILSQMPVKTPMLKMTLKDVMEMNEKARAKWLADVKNARDRIKTILNQKELWFETYSGPDGRRQELTLIPIEELP